MKIIFNSKEFSIYPPPTHTHLNLDTDMICFETKCAANVLTHHLLSSSPKDHIFSM